MSKSIIRFISLMLVITTVFGSCVCSYADTIDLKVEQSASYKLNAMKDFEINSENILVSNAVDSYGLQQDIDNAEDKAIERQSMIMVYVKNNIVMKSYIDLKSNVLMVAEKNTIFTYTGNYSIFLSGSVYGGTYSCAKKVSHAFRLKEKFTGLNGYVKYTIIKNAGTNGVFVYEKSTNSKIMYNKIYNSSVNGIRVQYDSNIYSVIGNSVTGCGQSGVDLDHANVKYIKNNILYKNTGHGISTNTAYIPSVPDYSKNTPCIIREIVGNKIYENKNQGIWIEKGCRVTQKIKGNNVYNNTLNGLAMDANTSVKSLSDNKIHDNKRSNISVLCKGKYSASITLGKNNEVYGSSKQGISVDGNIKFTISGSGNVISKNKMGAVELFNGAVLRINAKTTISSIKDKFGLAVCKKSKACLKYTVFLGKDSIYYDKSSKYYLKNCRVKGRIYKKK